jgi:Protein of unknown function (DUF4232)
VATVADLEDDLRRVLADPARELPPWPDAVQRVRSGMRRRHGRRVLARLWIGLAAVVATLFATLGPALVAEDDPAPAPSPSVIPWRELPYADPPSPSVPPRPVATSCRAEDIHLVSAESDGAGGTQYRFIRVRNDGSAECTLAARVRLRGTRNGSVHDIPATPRDDFVVMGSVPATIQPGEQAEAIVTTYGGCLDGRPETVYKLFRVVLPGGDLTVRESLNATCGVGAGQWHRVVESAGNESSPLLATISAPPKATLGTDLAFAVTLTNPTPAPVALGPCPNYIMGLTVKVKAGGVHQLNCADAQGRPLVVRPGGSVVFAMRLPLPSLGPGAEPGSGDLTWTMDGGVSARVPITIVAP